LIERRGGVWRGRSTRALPNQSVAKGTEYERAEKGRPITDDAREWEGWGTALKPAWEPVVLARKPLSESTVAANVLKWGTAALNIDGCRVLAADGDEPLKWETPRGGIWKTDSQAQAQAQAQALGRWPANIILDGSEEVVGAFPDLGKAGVAGTAGRHGFGTEYVNGGHKDGTQLEPTTFGDSGSAARFFYSQGGF
jgi:site-specific DNA-methyltransferase (adenine-specific)